eukprot:4428928-Prorocentrum_lima.AAC.1
MAHPHVLLSGGGLQHITMKESESLEHYKQGHIPKRKDCPVCQHPSGPVVGLHLRSDRAENFDTSCEP